MKSDFRWVSISLGIAISLGTTISIFLRQQNQVVAQLSSPKKTKLNLKFGNQHFEKPSRRFPPLLGRVRSQPFAPPSRGFPNVRDSGISFFTCKESFSKPLVALAPKFIQNDLIDKNIESVWGQTTMEHPTLWFFVPFMDRSTQLEFVLQNRESEEIYQSIISTPAKDGIIGVKIPKSKKPLELNQHYHWRLQATFFCDQSKKLGERVTSVDGWIQRVSLPVGIDISNNPTQIYVDKGIWYDAVTSLAQQRLKEPNDIQLRQDWKDLLGSTDLKEIENYSLLQ
jgi:Domain of Unknown Function (DUF928)